MARATVEACADTRRPIAGATSRSAGMKAFPGYRTYAFESFDRDLRRGNVVKAVRGWVGRMRDAQSRRSDAWAMRSGLGGR